MSFTAIDPATGRRIREYPEMSPGDYARAVDGCQEAFLSWRDTGMEERARLVRNLAVVLRERREDFAGLMTREMGKPLREARGEIEKCAMVCEFYAEQAPGYLAPQPVETAARRSFVTFQPIGIVFAIMPWNYPFWQVFRFAAPTLMAGNGALLKHAPNVPGCGLAIEGVFREAGFPDGLLRALLIDHGRAAELIADPRVRAVTLTGSTAAGRTVAATAAAHVKKSVLELGGNDPCIVLEDADLELATRECVASRLMNAGQSCIAAKRCIVVEPVLAELRERVVAAMGAATFGDPRDEASRIGPLAREDLRDRLHAQVRGSVERGASLLLGGEVPGRPGWFYPPTVLDAVAPGMPAYEDELFGPVLSIVPVADEREAVAVANDTRYGLGASVFTRDLERGRRIAAEEIEAGNCFVNAFVRSDPQLPFGGVKESGYGRELSLFGIHEFVNVKSVWVG